MELQNDWIGVTDRSYPQIMAAIRANFSELIPEITDLSDTELAMRLMTVNAGIGEQLNYMIDGFGREVFPGKARMLQSIISYSRSDDWRVPGGVQGQGVVTVRNSTALAADITLTDTDEVPGPVYSTDNGIKFRINGSYKLSAGQSAWLLPVRNVSGFTYNTVLATGDGTPNQRLLLPVKVVDESIGIWVNNVMWQRCESFFIAPGGNQYQAQLAEELVMEIQFGDGITGSIPGVGQSIKVKYEVCDGSAGNVLAGMITNIESGMPSGSGLDWSVNNLTPTSGGRYIQGINEMRAALLGFKRALQRAVTLDDFVSIALQHPNVRTAWPQFTNGRPVNLYVYGYSGPVSDGSLPGIATFMANYRFIGVPVTVLKAAEIRIRQVWRLQSAPGYRNISQASAGVTAMTAAMSRSVQTVNSSVHPGDLYAIMEALPGVLYSRLETIYALPTAVALRSSAALVWDVQVLPGSTGTVNWRLLYVANGQFQLFRNGDYLLNGLDGTTVTLPELNFNVTGPIAAGSEYIFSTYVYNTDIIIKEGIVGIPISLTEDVQVFAEGGY